MYAIGYDIGSSSIKAALIVAKTGAVVARIQEPAHELKIHSPQTDWAEQDPEIWWQHLCVATKRIIQTYNIAPAQIQSVGISYQMHGLVLVDDNLELVRPAIIWCDSRAVEIGEASFQSIGPQACLENCLNSPGNFTAAKLKWVMENEPHLYQKVRYAMLPGDYIALKLSGKPTTTIAGLSEGILWDFKHNQLAQTVINDLGLNAKLIPAIVSTVGHQTTVSTDGANATGLPADITIGYRAGDQPNNALSLNVLTPGEVAATAGTSGVVYGVTNHLVYDPKQRVNSFAHINHDSNHPSIGVLLCINGAGSLHRWMKQHISGNNTSYATMEEMANKVAIGAAGLTFLPFGNGTERMFQNRHIGAHLLNINLNLHDKAAIIRAGIEGIAFAFVYGIKIMQNELGMDLSKIRVGNDNLFQSTIFATTIATLSDATIEVYDTTGAIGAALAGAVGAGIIKDLKTATAQQTAIKKIVPDTHKTAYNSAYQRWLDALEAHL